MTFGAYRFRVFFTRLKQKQLCLELGLKENFTWYLIYLFLFPVKGESEVYYVDSVLHFLAQYPNNYVFYHINPWKMENGWGCWMKTMSGMRQLKRPDYFQALSVLGYRWWPSLGNHDPGFR